ncbi:putative receptor-like protein kinase [Senna tora]|uniref:Putative receptor-like protein kinase n=1 Tax=Senna tora TaxID=362788 RepID=A0A834XHP9_9FABA|nr:putative receptor-like protein kinase [Senna tora]
MTLSLRSRAMRVKKRRLKNHAFRWSKDGVISQIWSNACEETTAEEPRLSMVRSLELMVFARSPFNLILSPLNQPLLIVIPSRLRFAYRCCSVLLFPARCFTADQARNKRVSLVQQIRLLEVLAQKYRIIEMWEELQIEMDKHKLLESIRNSNKSRTVIIIVVPIIVAFILLVILICIYFKVKKGKKTIESEAESDDEIKHVETLHFEFETIRLATNNLGVGGFGPVYKHGQDNRTVPKMQLRILGSRLTSSGDTG